MFCNINFNLLNKHELFALDERPKFIITVNAQLIVLANTNRRFMNILNNNFTTFDGEVPYKIAKKMNIYNKAETLKGSEIIYDFIEFAQLNDLKIFLLGGKEESNKISVKKIVDDYGVQARGFSPIFMEYPFTSEITDECLRRIEEFSPDILFVGFGAPKQEFFIDDNYIKLDHMGVKFIVGCGGTFEFFSGKIKRSPKWISKMGFEGVYRLFQEFNKARLHRIIYSFRFFKYIKSSPDFPD